MSRRRRASEAGRAKLLDSWESRPEYGMPRGCVATTYTFKADFFEEQCLARFAGMQSDPAEDLHSYVVEREEKLSQVFACVLVDQEQVAPQRNLRWHQLPVRVPRGILHSKISLLVWEERIRVLIGSANLSEHGYRKNLENLVTLDFTSEGEAPLALLRECLAFLEEARKYAPGLDLPTGPQPALGLFLEDVKRRIRGWADEPWPRGEPRAVLMPVLPHAPSLFERLSELTQECRPNTASVVSPFYDEGEAALVVLDGLESIMSKRGARQLHFVSRGHELPSGKVEFEVPEEFRVPRSEAVGHTFGYVPPRVPSGADSELRPLHAKCLWLERDGRALFMVGSSNFTCNGTGVGGRANIELNLAFILPDSGSPFARACLAAIPSATSIGNAENVSFLVLHSRTPEGAEFAPLPSALGAAIFEPATSGGTLILELLGDLPPGLVVVDSAGKVLLDEAKWNSLGRPMRVALEWLDAKPPSHVRVSWIGMSGEPLSAIWVVNVSNPAALPPAEELRALTLEELLEVLTSARPLHDIVAVIRRRHEGGRRVAKQVLDPHAKVDTSRFLLQRMRRLSRALEGLRARLERPVFSAEALRWRLFGPVGPVEIARRLAVDEGEGAAFLMAELALAVRAAKVKPSGTLTRSGVENMVAEVVRTLRELAGQRADIPANLKQYVRSTFEEAA